MGPRPARVIVVLRQALAELDAFDQPRVEGWIRVSAADHAADAFTLESRRLSQHSPECERARRLSLEIRQREQESHSFHDLLFGYFYHTRQTVTEDLPVSVAQPQHPGPIGYRCGFVLLSDDASCPEGFGGIIRQRRLGGKDLNLFSASLDSFNKSGRQTAAAYGGDYEIQIESRANSSFARPAFPSITSGSS